MSEVELPVRDVDPAIELEADLAEVRRQLEDGVLRRGCEWAAAALGRGNAWSATQHRFWVTYREGQLLASEI